MSTGTAQRLYVPDRFAYQRRRSRPVLAGSVQIGGDAPLVLQSMCTAPTQDVAATVAQCISLAEVGCQIVRVTAPGVKDAQALRQIRQEFSAAGFAEIPLVADIHFRPAAAMEAVEHVEKVRVNPGNFADKKFFKVREYSDAEYDEELQRLHERFSPLVLRAKELGRALRIGTNHGSLSDRIMNRYGDTPSGMVESAMEFIRIAEDNGFRDIVVSMKASNPKVMVQAYRLLAATLDEHGERYPIHLGVTEAGDGEDGRVKGAAGIGALLEDGIGDTIRVSLTEEPEAEIPVARALAERYEPPPFAIGAVLGETVDEAIDCYDYRRRVAEILRLGGGPDDEGVPVGGGQVPLVLGPLRLPTDDDVEPLCDAAVDDADLWGHPSSALMTRCRTRAAMPVPVRRVAAGAAIDAPERSLVLIDLPEHGQVAALRRSVRALPDDVLVGIAEPGPLGATRAYRLLAALSEERFRAAEARESGSGIRHPICLTMPEERDLIALSTVLGGLLVDGIGDCIYLPAAERPRQLAFTILQAVKARTTRADYVACPSCGRTLFDLMEVTEHIRSATKHLDGVTIAIMGCIVNGPGEMADADFGYVGASPGKITLYRGKQAVRRNVPMQHARDELIQLIKDHDMWQEPPGGTEEQS